MEKNKSKDLKIYTKDEFKLHYNLEFEQVFLENTKIGYGGQGAVYELEGHPYHAIKLINIENLK